MADYGWGAGLLGFTRGIQQGQEMGWTAQRMQMQNLAIQQQQKQLAFDQEIANQIKGMESSPEYQPQTAPRTDFESGATVNVTSPPQKYVMDEILPKAIQTAYKMGLPELATKWAEQSVAHGTRLALVAARIKDPVLRAQTMARSLKATSFLTGLDPGKVTPDNSDAINDLNKKIVPILQGIQDGTIGRVEGQAQVLQYINDARDAILNPDALKSTEAMVKDVITNAEKAHSETVGDPLVDVTLPNGTTTQMKASVAKAFLETKETSAQIDQKYQNLEQQRLLGQPLTTEQQAWMQAYKNQKMLVPSATAQIKLEYAGPMAAAAAETKKAIAEQEGFKSWTPEAKERAFMFETITGKPPISTRGFASGDRQVYSKEYTQWMVDKNISARDVALMQADYKAQDSSLRNMTKQEAPMNAFVMNIGKQVDKVQTLYNKDDRLGIRLLDLPIRELKVKAQGSGDEAVKASYLMEISREIGKLSTGSQASIAELSVEAQKKWDKIHDVNLSLNELMKILQATKDQASMRIETWRQAKAMVRDEIRFGESPSSTVGGGTTPPTPTTTKVWKKKGNTWVQE